MPNKPNIGDLYTSNNEFDANVTITIGNTIANVWANSTLLRVANTQGSANLFPTQLIIGTSVINATSVNAAAIYFNGAGVLTISTADQQISGGARVTVLDLGTITTGTVTPDPGDRPMQRYINNGAHTLAPGANYGCYLITIVNGATAGAITTSGWTKVSGDSFITTNGAKWRCHASVDGDGSVLIIQALQ